MKIYISYFNNIRNFSKYDIPLSTAMWDPKWFTKHMDKNGVVNGLRCLPLVLPISKWEELKDEQCSKNCKFKHGSCKFEKVYYEYLQTIEFDTLIEMFKFISKYISILNNEDVNKFRIVLIVHEKPSVDCAERPMLIKYFKEHNADIEEWRKL